MANKSTNTKQTTTQDFLEVYDITNNLVILKSGMVSVALTVSAINFGLLAEEEQDAVMYAYAGLLNSLNFPIQIVIHSQTKDVTKYLSLLKDQEESATSPIIRKRINQYREFVANLIQERNVLDKKFFVVIPATALELGFASPKGLLPGQADVDISTFERSVIVEKAKNVLEPRRDHLIAQFARIGLYARELETQEIIQLFYVRYNPEAIEGQQIEESASYTAPLVRAQVHESQYDQLATAGGTTPFVQPTPTPPDLFQPTQPAETQLQQSQFAADQSVEPSVEPTPESQLQPPQPNLEPAIQPDLQPTFEPTPEPSPTPQPRAQEFIPPPAPDLQPIVTAQPSFDPNTPSTMAQDAILDVTPSSIPDTTPADTNQSFDQPPAQL